MVSGGSSDAMVAVAGHLAQDLVVLEQRDGDHLAEQAGVDLSSSVQAVLSFNERGAPNSTPIIRPLPHVLHELMPSIMPRHRLIGRRRFGVLHQRSLSIASSV